MEGSFKGLTKGAWTAEEDNLLKECIDKYGEGKWHQVPLRAGLNRCRKSCRLRWLNYLKPGINRAKFSIDEVDLLFRLHRLLGNRWSLIAGRLPGRTANDVKNYWNTNLGKKQDTCCKIKVQKKEITCSTSTPVAQKLNVISLPPRSFSNNDLLSVGLDEVSTCNKNDGKCKFVNNLMDRESMWWERVLEKSQEEDAAGPEATTVDEADSSSMNSMSLTFDVDGLWSLFN